MTRTTKVKKARRPTRDTPTADTEGSPYFALGEGRSGKLNNKPKTPSEPHSWHSGPLESCKEQTNIEQPKHGLVLPGRGETHAPTRDAGLPTPSKVHSRCNSRERKKQEQRTAARDPTGWAASHRAEANQGGAGSRGPRPQAKSREPT